MTKTAAACLTTGISALGRDRDGDGAGEGEGVGGERIMHAQKGFYNIINTRH